MAEEFEEIYAELDSLQTSSEKASVVIERAKELRRIITYKIRELRDLIENYKRGNIAQPGGQRAKVKIDDETLMRCHRILWDEIKEATIINNEFNHPFFLSRLQEAAFNPEVITIDSIPNGFFVNINLNIVAGSLGDYAKAIERTRAILGIADLHELTSYFWQEKLYSPAREGTTIPARKQKEGSKRKVKSAAEKTREAIEKYWKTMQLRMDKSGKIAPFWQILDQGTVELMSDRGGDAYPVNSPTNFVDKARTRIKELLSATARNLSSPDDENVQINIENIEALMRSYLNLLDKIDELIEGLGEEKIIEKALERILSYEERADPGRLEEVIRVVKAGDLSSLNITAEGRVEVTAPGGIRTRISLLLISRIFGEEMER